MVGLKLETDGRRGRMDGAGVDEGGTGVSLGGEAFGGVVVLGGVVCGRGGLGRWNDEDEEEDALGVVEVLGV